MKVLLTKPKKSKYFMLKEDGGIIPNECNPTKNIDKDNTALPNCVSYALGRFIQISEEGGIAVNVCAPCGGLFLKYNKGFKQGKKPKLGAIAVWSGGTDGYGHVAIVEQIKSNGTVVFSESTYNNCVFRTREGKGSNYWDNKNYKFEGFIYNPGINTKAILEFRKAQKSKVMSKEYDFNGDGKVNLKDLLLLRKSIY